MFSLSRSIQGNHEIMKNHHDTETEKTHTLRT